jgi:hypothetical protein
MSVLTLRSRAAKISFNYSSTLPELKSVSCNFEMNSSDLSPVALIKSANAFALSKPAPLKIVVNYSASAPYCSKFKSVKFEATVLKVLLTYSGMLFKISASASCLFSIFRLIAS